MGGEATRMSAVSVAVDGTDGLGEGPSWDDRTGQLTWVDIVGRRVHSWSPGDRARATVSVPDEVSLALPRHEGGRVMTQVDRVVLADDDSWLSALCEIESDNPHTRLNDGCCDDQGRLWVGTYSTRGRPEAALYVVGPGGTVRCVLEGMVAANGVEWNAAGDILHVADTGRCRIDRFALHDGATGPRLEHRGTVLAEDGAHGRPDGLTVDTEGSVWVAMWGGAHVRRYTPDGILTAEVPLPVTYPTAVALGGADRRTLFVTTSRHHLPDPSVEPEAGSVLSMTTPVPGLPTRRFAG
jgi:sugar lactone lactonase YvrE